MKNKKVLDLILYIIPIILGLLIIYLAYTWFFENNEPSGPQMTYTALFIKNGADSVSQNDITCTTDKGKDSCDIILPSIIAKNKTVVGWNTENDEKALYKVGDSVSINNNMVFYAITYYENTLTIFNNGVDYISNDIVSCRVYNTNNECNVKVPNFNKKGYENRGYSLYKDALTGIIFPNSNYLLKKDVTLYPVYNTLTRRRVIDVSNTFNKYGIVIEVERGCNSSTYNKYLDYLDKININANYLLVGSKITFLSANTFDKMWGAQYLGMNYGPNALRLFDVKCPNSLNQDYYATMVHELAHTWDFYYSNHFNKNITDENDMVNLFIKYKSLPNRPFRAYSYTNIKEFFADMVRYYYFKYLDPKSGFVNLDFPSDIKNTLEKYICITKNNYQITSCTS